MTSTQSSAPIFMALRWAAGKGHVEVVEKTEVFADGKPRVLAVAGKNGRGAQDRKVEDRPVPSSREVLDRMASVLVWIVFAFLLSVMFLGFRTGGFRFK